MEKRKQRPNIITSRLASHHVFSFKRRRRRNRANLEFSKPRLCEPWPDFPEEELENHQYPNPGVDIIRTEEAGREVVRKGESVDGKAGLFGTELLLEAMEESRGVPHSLGRIGPTPSPIRERELIAAIGCDVADILHHCCCCCCIKPRL